MAYASAVEGLGQCVSEKLLTVSKFCNEQPAAKFDTKSSLIKEVPNFLSIGAGTRYVQLEKQKRLIFESWGKSPYRLDYLRDFVLGDVRMNGECEHFFACFFAMGEIPLFVT